MKAAIKRILLRALFALTATVSANLGLSQTTNNVIKQEHSDFMTNHIAQADTLLARFKQTKSIDQLEAACVAVGSIAEPRGDKVARQQRAIMYFKLLAVIDENRDNTNYAVHLNWVAPPSTPEGVRYPPGVDPKVIKDPAVRSQYEAAIKENDEKNARALFQTRLRNVEQLANIEVERFLPAYYTTSDADQSELENLMERAKLCPDRVQRIKRLFHK